MVYKLFDKKSKGRSGVNIQLESSKQYGTDIAHNTESENLTLMLCLNYITRPFCVSGTIFQQSLARLFNSPDNFFFLR